jgi:aminopeptidase N
MQLASNEGREAWLDEGFADYATTRVLATVYPPDRSLLDLGPAKMSYEAIQRAQYLAAGVGQPLARASWEYDGFLQYGATVYSKGTMTFLTLERLYGEERFLAALRQHFDRWRWRHPTTQDLQASLEAGLSADLDWFFQPLVFGTGTVEYRATDVSSSDAEVERRGDVAFPVQVSIRAADGTTRLERWDATTTSTDVEAGPSPISRVQVDPGDVIRVEANVLDNGRDVSASPAPLLTLAARWLALLQSGLIASLPG